MTDALEVGKAAEHLVCADLILQGYRAFLSDQGCPFDVLVALPSGQFIRVQVKATQHPKNVNAKGRNERHAYSWAVRRRGKNQQAERLSGDHCDVVALVALDVRKIAYLPLDLCGQTVQIDTTPNREKRTSKGMSWAAGIGDFPFAPAVRRDQQFYEDKRKIYITCANGHPRIAGRACPQCSRATYLRRTPEQRAKYRETQRNRTKNNRERAIQGTNPEQISGDLG